MVQVHRKVCPHGHAQAQLQAAQAQQAVDAQQAAVEGGIVQGTPHDGGAPPQGADSAANFTYRNRARRKACEKPSVRTPCPCSRASRPSLAALEQGLREALGAHPMLAVTLPGLRSEPLRWQCCWWQGFRGLTAHFKRMVLSHVGHMHKHIGHMQKQRRGPEDEWCGGGRVQGTSQIRQSFSKRKRGIAQKAYQLYKITDAKAGSLLLCPRMFPSFASITLLLRSW